MGTAIRSVLAVMGECPGYDAVASLLPCGSFSVLPMFLPPFGPCPLCWACLLPLLPGPGAGHPLGPRTELPGSEVNRQRLNKCSGDAHRRWVPPSPAPAQRQRTGSPLFPSPDLRPA